MAGWIILATVALVSWFFIFLEKDRRKGVLRLFIKEAPTPLIAKDFYESSESKNKEAEHENAYTSVQKKELNNARKTAQDIEEAHKRTAVAGTFVSVNDNTPQEKDRYAALLLKAGAIEKKMERLAQNNDIDGLNTVSLEINSLFYEIVNNKSRTELDNMLIMKAKTLMAACDDWVKQCEHNNVKHEKNVTINEIRPAINNNKTYSDSANNTYANSASKPYPHLDNVKTGVPQNNGKLNSIEENPDTEKQQAPNPQNYDLFEYAQYLMAKANKENETEPRKDGFNFSNFQ